MTAEMSLSLDSDDEESKEGDDEICLVKGPKVQN